MSESIGSRAAWLFNRLPKIGSRRGSRGFTLIESLCAVAVLAITLSALFQSYSRSLRAVRVMDAFTDARILAESILEEAMATPGKPLPGGGRLGPFDWKLAVAPGITAKTEPGITAKTEEKDPAPISLYFVSVEVAWPPSRSTALTSLKLVQGK